MTRLELLAPARNADIGIAAIRCGADAVYIGGPAFGARVAAANPEEDILRLCRYAGQFGAKVFVTVNTLADDEQERRGIVKMMLSLKDKGVSAFIIQDCTLLPLLEACGPWQEEFHASTQCAIRTPERALQLCSMGFRRLILERELSLEQIRSIRHAVPPDVELECFVHGAVCVCYSGDCYLSEYLTGRSANRGECAQPCRGRYDLVNASGDILIKDKPLLSVKDLRLIDRIGTLASAGVTSFKIEGRLKNESYVKNVVRAYSLALDRLVSNNKDQYCRASWGKVSGGFEPKLDKTFNRGYTTLFLDGEKGGWNSGDSAKAMGEELGRAHVLSDTAFSLRGSIHNGDGLCFINRKGEVVGIRADRVEGDRIICKSTEGMYDGTTVWRNRDGAFEKELENNVPERLIDITADFVFGQEQLRVNCSASGHGLPGLLHTGATFPIADLPEALNQDRIRAMIATQTGKTSGIYSFHCGRIDSDRPLPLLSAGFINGIRRGLAEKLSLIPLSPASTTTAGNPAPASHPEATVSSGIPPIPAGRKDLSHPVHPGELMRTRYCILAELGKCLRTEEGRKFASGGLALKNNGRRIPLRFDCASCEMVLLDKEHMTSENGQGRKNG